MKLKICLLFLLFNTTFFAQKVDFTVVVKDISTGLPIEEVTITCTKTKQGFLTNKEGIAIIILENASDLLFEHFSYKKYTVKAADLNQKLNEVYLETSARLLEEVILTSQHPQEILKEVIDVSLQKLTIPMNLKVYLREFYKKNNKIVFFNDGLINFQLLGSNKAIKSDILVEQNRAIGLLDNDISAELLGYDLNDIIQNYYQFKYLDEILTNSSKKNYDFQIVAHSDNDNHWVIKVSPLPDSKKVFSDFLIVYDTESKLILEINSIIGSSKIEDLKQSNAYSRQIYKLEFKNTFKLENGVYYLANSKEVIGFEKKLKKEKRLIEVKNHMVVTNFDKKIFGYNEKNIFKDKSLINKKTEFFNNYWDIESGFVFTKEEKEVIEQLSNLR